MDYAIVQLYNSPGSKNGYVELSLESPASELALLHHPLGKPLKISVHSFDQTFYDCFYLQTFHDTDFCSSDGAYIGPNGKLVALHLGSEIEDSLKRQIKK